jgi:hypothetical protein
MTPPCLECGSTDAREVSGETIYPHRPDLFSKRLWLCSCGAYVGCHPNSNVPLGAPAGEQTRRARMAAHAVFDPLWKSGERSRREAYRWLAERMGMNADECHIGRMTLAQARRAAEICMEEKEANSWPTC